MIPPDTLFIRKDSASQYLPERFWYIKPYDASFENIKLKERSTYAVYGGIETAKLCYYQRVEKGSPMYEDPPQDAPKGLFYDRDLSLPS